MNRLDELWAVFDWATAGELLGKEADFKRMYAKPIEKARDANATEADIEMGKNASDKLKGLLKRHFLQRMKSVHLADLLPPKTELCVWVDLSNRQRDVYANFLVENAQVSDVLSGRAKKAPITAITELKKLCGHPLLHTMDRDELDEYLDRCDDDDDLLNDSPKLRLLRDMVVEFYNTGHKTLIFCNSTRMLDIIQKVLALASTNVPVGRIDGKVKQADRQALVDEFNSKGSHLGAMLLSTKAAGVGLTLTGADISILYDLSWTPAEDAQAVDRCYRIGQERPVLVFRLVTAGTVEEKVYEKQVFKDGIKRAVLGEGGSKDFERYFTKEQMSQLLTLDEPGNCAIIKMIENQGLGYDCPYQSIVDHRATLGVTRHNEFYTTLAGKQPTEQGEFREIGHSVRSIRRQSKNVQEDRDVRELGDYNLSNAVDWEPNEDDDDLDQQEDRTVDEPDENILSNADDVNADPDDPR